jgi:glycosyltransferase involved in cell wall biosynthesis
MRILILNWRDTRSARGGGAERVTQEVASRLVARGHEVTWLSSAQAGLPSEEVLDGVTIVRRGSELTTRLHAPRLARAGFDVVVDAINTVPYLAPLWARVPTVVFFHQLARDVWWYEAPRAVAAFGWTIEPLYLQVYRRTPAVTVSDSTRKDLRRFGLKERIDVIPLAVDRPEAEPDFAAKPLTGNLVGIGRLRPSKRFDHAIRALRSLRSTHPHARLDLIGSGSEHDRLAALAGELGLGDAVRLLGAVGSDERDAILREADAVIGTSVREGWGLTVTEGAVLGTPAVVYDIPGFRDSVVDGRTGIVTKPTPDGLADGVRRLLADPAAYDAIRRRAYERALATSWDDTATAFEAALGAAVSARSRG